MHLSLTNKLLLWHLVSSVGVLRSMACSYPLRQMLVVICDQFQLSSRRGLSQHPRRDVLAFRRKEPIQIPPIGLISALEQ